MAAVITLATPPAADGQTAMPDFTKGDSIPSQSKHDWNLGPTGMRGWMYSDKMVTSDARQISITMVDEGSPASRKIAAGDVILGIGGKRFSRDPREEFGRSITAAEQVQGSGRLSLIRWRAGRTDEVVLELPVLGSYSATAPYQCPKSKKVLENGIAGLVARMSDEGYGNHADPIPRSLNALALLAAGQSKHLPLLQREAKWAAGFSTDSFRSWHYGYLMIFLAEYAQTSGDAEALAGLRRIALETANGQSAVGSWGHDFALPSGRLKGYGMMNSPGLTLTIGLALAREAGVNDPGVSRAIELSAKLIRFHIGKGAVPYGDHPSWIETHEDNGKCGMAAVLFNRLGETKGANYFTSMALASHGSERDCGHTGNFFNLTWSLPAIAQGGPNATGGWMREFGSWYFDLARRWDGTFAHQGPPEPDHDSYHGFDATGAYLLAYALPLKRTTLTGKATGKIAPMTPEAVEEILAAGRGWTNKHRHQAYDGLSEEKLLARLGSWSPIVRIRAAEAIARRKERPVEAITALLNSPRLEERIGACHALEELGGDAAPAVPALRGLLKHTDLWVRVKAADALAAIGEPAMVALPELLVMLARGPNAEDPRAMEQRFLSFAIFGKMIGRKPLPSGFDPEQLRHAMARGLQNQDGHTRSQISEVYGKLTFEQIQPLLPAILEAIVTPSPSGEMFADGVRLNGLKLLSRHHIEQGMRGCVDYLRSQNPWASEHRTPEILEVLVAYGAHARVVIPQLKETAAYFAGGEPDFPKHLSDRKAKFVREAIERIESSTEQPALRSLN